MKIITDRNEQLNEQLIEPANLSNIEVCRAGKLVPKRASFRGVFTRMKVDSKVLKLSTCERRKFS